MMDFIYELYQNDNFVLYLTIALVILIILFVLVLIFGKRDQKLEETKRLQKIDVDAFKEEKKEEVKLEVEPKEEEKVEPKEESKSIFDDTLVMPIIKESNDTEEIDITTFKPSKVEVQENEEVNSEEVPPRKREVDVEEESKPINIKELDEMQFDDIDLEKDLGELDNIKKEFDSIEIPEVKKEEKKPYKAGPQVFSSVFVKKEEPKMEEVKPVVENKEEKAKVSLFSIEDDEEEIELPTLKSEAKKEEAKEEVKTFKIDDISGETYNIK